MEKALVSRGLITRFFCDQLVKELPNRTSEKLLKIVEKNSTEAQKSQNKVRMGKIGGDWNRLHSGKREKRPPDFYSNLNLHGSAIHKQVKS